MLLDKNHESEQKIYEHMNKTAFAISDELGSAITKVGPITWPKSEINSVVEFLMRAVVGQQLSTKVAKTIWQRIKDAADHHQDNLEHFIHQADDSEIRKLGVSYSKIKTMRAIIQAEISGEIEETKLQSMNHQDRAECLKKIWGIGDWSANIVSMFYFNDTNVWPKGDKAAESALLSLTSKTDKENTTARSQQNDIIEITNKFIPYRSYLAFAMWRYIDNKF